MLHVCRALLVFVVLTVIVMTTLLHSTSTSTATHEVTTGRHEGLTAWLRLHPPRQASHDAEILRRRMLGSIVELSSAALAEHAPAIIASLDYPDGHVRRLAVGMLTRLEPVAIESHTAAIMQRMGMCGDAEVRAEILQALSRIENATLLQPHVAQLMPTLADADPAVRWASIDVIGMLDADVIAPHLLAAVDQLMQTNDLSLVRALISRCVPRLEGGQRAQIIDGLRARQLGDAL